jgi:hypothetical protein
MLEQKLVVGLQGGHMWAARRNGLNDERLSGRS